MSGSFASDIPDFGSEEYENLVNVLNKGTCVFFGAGVSKLAGYCLWEELRVRIVDYFWDNKNKILGANRMLFDLSLSKNLKNHTDTIEAFDYLYFLDKSLFYSGIKSIFYRDERNSSSKVYHELKKLNNGKNFFITTNIDTGFEKYLGITEEQIAIFPSLNYMQIPLLTYLHGRIDKEDSWIFTREQYNRGYIGNGMPCMNFLKNIFDNFSVLFIGYGLMDFEIKQAISLTKQRKEHYWLEASSRNEEDNLNIRGATLKKNYNIKLITYSVDNHGHDIALNVLNSLYSEIERR